MRIRFWRTCGVAVTLLLGACSSGNDAGIETSSIPRPNTTCVPVAAPVTISWNPFEPMVSSGGNIGVDARAEYYQLVAAVNQVHPVVDTGVRLIGNDIGCNDGGRPDKEELRIATAFAPTAVQLVESGTLTILRGHLGLSAGGTNQRTKDYGALVEMAHQLSTANVKVSVSLSNGTIT